ncbi:MAG: hypothetical protein ACM3S4_04930 [Burkholderiales bacterium]
MKKVLLVFVIAMLMLLICSLTAFAAGTRTDAGTAAPAYDVGNGAIAVDNDVGGVLGIDFVTWEILITPTGCIIFTVAITQLFKSRWPQKWPTQILSYIIALIILILAHFMLGMLTLSSVGLCVFNAVVVCFAANGAYNNLLKSKNTANISVTTETGTTPPANST